ncbi:phosphoribosyltransferase [Pararhodobacter zhoushanensis]|uniref:phosphoribosyltransferase n=1 Tax=Pararhodobacter zhoushanensis TaxID=2479545 RepID=UPI000F8DFFD4|nr:phosphoribosyltransferase [Pararhodobacter zhoushanensis]
MTLAPHDFWQQIFAPGSYATGSGTVHTHHYPATLPDGRQILLPIRVLPGDGTQAVASLIVNQASFVVHDALVEGMAALWADAKADVVIGVPTLGLTLATSLARRFGHARMVALGTSRKFWYDEALSEPLKSITTPGGGKDIYLDPRMLPLLQGRRVLLVDDVVSSGSSLAAVLRLLDKAGIAPVGVAVAMEQGTKWRQTVPGPERVKGVFATPILRAVDGGFVNDAA